MVAKQKNKERTKRMGLNLAKIHMVAKHKVFCSFNSLSLNLAKIHMVAKLVMQQLH